jgi:anti-sigma factor RsiW
MNEQEQLKLQAYLDGELTSRERDEVAGLLDARADGRELLVELQHTRAALRGGELERRLDCSREFYWNRIEREISAAVQEPATPPVVGWLGWLRRHVAQAVGAGAALALLAISLTVLYPPRVTAESEWEVLHPHTGMVNLRDYQSGVTVVMLYDRTKPDFTSGQ